MPLRGEGAPPADPRSPAHLDEEPPPPPFMVARRAWGEWRPFMVNESRCPERARRFAVGEEHLAALSPEQRQAVFLLEAGLSCFVTGPGGTGKSQLIRVVREAAQAAGLRVRVTASTGIAARNIGGITLHRLIGWGLMKNLSPHEVGRRVAALRDGDDGRVRRWAETDLLVVDEVSMLNIATLQQADAAARAARARSGAGDERRPFGGIQLLFLGDFAQLTMSEDPAAQQLRSRTPAELASHPAAGAAGPVMPFLHPAWAELVPFTVELRTIFRQRDASFRDLLNRLRLGRPLRGDILTLNAVGGTAGPVDASAHHNAFPDLCAFRAVAAELNGARIGALKAEDRPSVVYAPQGPEELLAAAAAQGAPVTEPVEICVGARVLLTKNLDQERGLVNGSLGEVVGFADAAPGDPFPSLPVVRWEGQEEPHTVTPAAWQPDEEEAGPGTQESQPPKAKRPRPKAAARKGPAPSSSVTNPELTVAYMPLLCAWALTVHRAQGMTLAAARIHGSSMRTPALLYTAISRLRGMDGLRIRGSINEANVVALPEVVRYYDALRRLVDASGEEEEEEEEQEQQGAEAEEDGSWVDPEQAATQEGADEGAPALLAVVPTEVLAQVCVGPSQ